MKEFLLDLAVGFVDAIVKIWAGFMYGLGFCLAIAVMGALVT